MLNDNEEQLSQLSKKELVKLILNQQTLITELQTKIEKLILSRDLDSKNSSKPPSSDLLKKPEGNKLIGEALTEIVDEAFKQHRLWRESSNQQNYLDSATELKTRINLTLNNWIEKAGYEAGKLLRNLKLKADQWWYFLDHPEIAPDNNLAERALRLAVTKRKLSGGSRSLERFQQTANNLSVIQTCRFQGRSVMDFFTQSLMATVAVSDRPSLISYFDT